MPLTQGLWVIQGAYFAITSAARVCQPLPDARQRVIADERNERSALIVAPY